MPGAYEIEWMQALERTKRYGLPVPEVFAPQSSLIFTQARMAELPKVVEKALVGLTVDDVVGQCLAIHFGLVPVLQRWLGCPVYFTLGWIDDGAAGMFKFGDELIQALLDGGHRGGTINVHAWLTLPTMEIFDVTLATSIARINNLPEGYGGVFSQHPDGLKGMAFKPVLVGHEFLERSGLLRFQPLP